MAVRFYAGDEGTYEQRPPPSVKEWWTRRQRGADTRSHTHIRPGELIRADDPRLDGVLHGPGGCGVAEATLPLPLCLPAATVPAGGRCCGSPFPSL